MDEALKRFISSLASISVQFLGQYGKLNEANILGSGAAAYLTRVDALTQEEVDAAFPGVGLTPQKIHDAAYALELLRQQLDTSMEAIVLISRA